MMPLAPTPIVPVPSKPKIGFSIDSIVGGGRSRNDEDNGSTRLSDHRLDIERDDHSPMDVVEGGSSPTSRTRVRLNSGGARSPGAHSEESDRPLSRSSSVESYPNSRRTPLSSHQHHQSLLTSQYHQQPSSQNHHHHLSQHRLTLQQQQHQIHRSTHQNLDYSTRSLTNRSNSGGSTPNNSPSPPVHRMSGRSSESPASSAANHPQPPPVVRPSPNYLGPPPGAASAAAAVVAAEQLKNLYGLPAASHTGSGPQTQNEYHSQHLALAANIAAAQHFQAANLAVALQAHHGPPHGPYPHASGPAGPHPPPHSHQPPRDSYPLYPWLLSRHGRIFPQRFPGGQFLISSVSFT
jgi:homeobox protein EMX